MQSPAKETYKTSPIEFLQALGDYKTLFINTTHPNLALVEVYIIANRK